MKTNFKILWIDDQREEDGADLVRKKTNIEYELKTECFEVVIDTKSSFSMGEINSGLAEYDLILVDFDLKDDDIGGLQIIEGLRDADIFSEILFYSQSYEVDKEVLEFCYEKSKFLEGVFVCHRGDEAFKEKFKQIINILVNKTNNLNTMRGLVLAETADLDYILCEIIDKLCDIHAISKNGNLYIKNHTVKPSVRDFSIRHPYYFFPFKSYTYTDWLKKTGSNELYCEMLSNSYSPIFQYIKGETVFIGQIGKYRNFYADERNDLAHGNTAIDPKTLEWKANNVPYNIGQLKLFREQLLEFRECFEDFRDNRI